MESTKECPELGSFINRFRTGYYWPPYTQFRRQSYFEVLQSLLIIAVLGDMLQEQ